MAKRHSSKGNRGEREVAKLLTEWWLPFESIASDGKPIEFVKTPKSGGWSHSQSFSASGDVMTNSHQFPFSIEVKRVEAWNWDWLARGMPSPVWGFWRQCQGDAEKVGKEPMLWFRKNRRPWHVMIRSEYAKRIVIRCVPELEFDSALERQINCIQVPNVYLGIEFLRTEPCKFVE